MSEDDVSGIELEGEALASHLMCPDSVHIEPGTGRTAEQELRASVLGWRL